MNNRLEDLMYRAGLTAQGCWDSMDDYDQKAIEKFAELLVKECVQTLIDNTPERYTNESAEEDWDKGYDRAMRDCVHHIQEHFGIEE